MKRVMKKKSSANEMKYSSATNENSDILHFLNKTTAKSINETVRVKILSEYKTKSG